jgi:ATP-dependent Clp protease ATP-binding subunit ClpA
MNPTAWRDSESALEAGLTALGFRGGEPRYDTPQQSPQQSKSRLLQQSAVDLTEEARSNRAVPTIGRDDEVERLASCVLCWGQTRLGLIVGESGTGKTNLLCGLARLLAGQRRDIALLRVDVAEILAGTFLEAERETIILELLREALAVPNAVLALERLDCALTREGAVGNLISQALDDGLRLVGTALPGALRRFRRPPLGRRIQVVKMQEPTAKHAGRILAALKDQIAAHHRVQIDDALLAVAIRLAHGLPGRLPAKAIALLDQAASSAALLKSPVVSPDDLFAAARHLGVEMTDNANCIVDEDNEGHPGSRDN